jgi:hypothetical protein
MERNIGEKRYPSPVHISGRDYILHRETKDEVVYRCCRQREDASSRSQKCNYSLAINKDVDFSNLGAVSTYRRASRDILEHRCQIPPLRIENNIVGTEEDTVWVTNDNLIREMMIKDPLKGPSYFWEEAQKLHVKISKNHCKDLLVQIRGELYPKDNLIALSAPFCVTREGLGGGKKFSALQIEIEGWNDDTGRFIIFTSPALLQNLKERTWFVDGTFKTAPQNYTQLITLISFHRESGSYIPCAYVAASSKKAFLYESIFTNILLLARRNRIEIDPQYLMCDFEEGLRSAFRKTFPRAKIMGCYFHFCKALWDRVRKVGLATSEVLSRTYTLIMFCKILVHIPIEERKTIWQFVLSRIQHDSEEKGKDPESKVKEERFRHNFKQFTNYFEKNWLGVYYVESASPNNDVLFVRTNNICERYNKRLGEKISITKPRMSILVAKLLEEEQLFRSTLMRASVGTQLLANEVLLPQERSISAKGLSGPISDLQCTIAAFVGDTPSTQIMDKLYRDDKEIFYFIKRKVQDAYSSLYDNLCTNRSESKEDLIDDEVNLSGEESGPEKFGEMLLDEMFDDDFQVFNDMLTERFNNQISFREDDINGDRFLKF